MFVLYSIKGNNMTRFIRRFVTLVILGAALLLETLAPAGAQSTNHVDVAFLKGVVDPVMARYITGAIDKAINDGAVAIVIQMDTPGGDDSSMRQIISKMLASPVPVIVYVGPSGARAASAGTFITMASNIAAMAPATNIGSAHPVGAGGQDITGVEGDKVTNDAIAYIRTVATKRGHNADWAEQAVRNSVNITEQEAVDQKVVNLIATDMRDLLNKVNGQQVTVSTGTVTLETAGAGINEFKMTSLERLLQTLVDPTIAYLLLTIGMWSLIAEFTNPGAILPGVAGAICLILAFISFQSLPLNWGGVALIALSVVLFIADIKAPTHGILTAGGIVSFILGSVVLFSPFSPQVPALPTGVSVPWPWIALMSTISIVVFTYAIGAGIRAQARKVVVGPQLLVGATGVAKSDLLPQGVVLLQDEEWTAVAEDGDIRKGDRIQVVGRDSLILRVKALSSKA